MGPRPAARAGRRSQDGRRQRDLSHGYRILCVGRRGRDPVLDVAEQYLGRLQRYVPAELVRVRDGTLEEERRELAARLRPGARLVALDERGKAITTRQLADLIGRWQHQARPTDFLIGGADGLHPDFKKGELWQLSSFTLPHRLALALLTEQLYRAHTVLRGEPYHRD